MDDMNIVIIDDDEFFNKLTVWSVSDVLPENGKVFGYTSWESYLDNFDDSLPVSVFILDHHLDGLCGLDILKKLKILHPESKFIVLSGQYEVSTAIEYFHLGVYEYITKGTHSQTKLNNEITKIIKECELNKKLHATRTVLLLTLSALAVATFSIVSYFISK